MEDDYLTGVTGATGVAIKSDPHTYGRVRIDGASRPPILEPRTIVSRMRVSLSDVLRVPEDKRDAYMDNIKDIALRRLVEEADLVNKVEYETIRDAYSLVVTATIKVI